MILQGWDRLIFLAGTFLEKKGGFVQPPGGGLPVKDTEARRGSWRGFLPVCRPGIDVCLVLWPEQTPERFS